MAKSMTGYGRSEVKSRSYGGFFIEIQGVNRKHCDINITVPKTMSVLEPKIRAIVAACIARGRINVHVGQVKVQEEHKLWYFDKDMVKAYYRNLKAIKKELGLKGDLDIGLISGCRDFISSKEPPELKPASVWPYLSRGLKKAIKCFQDMREREGATICRQIKKPLMDISKRLQEIRDATPLLLDHFIKRLRKRIQDLGVNVKNDDERVQKEVAILAEHADITEELNRMQSHLDQFRVLMKKPEPVGRNMDFLLQEMMREMNTMGSKALHTDILTQVIYIKGQLEKIREQIQNIE